MSMERQPIYLAVNVDTGEYVLLIASAPVDVRRLGIPFERLENYELHVGAGDDMRRVRVDWIDRYSTHLLVEAEGICVWWYIDPNKDPATTDRPGSLKRCRLDDYGVSLDDPVSVRPKTAS